MKKYLITGFSGFVSNYFIEFLEKNEISSEVLGIDVFEPELKLNNYTYISVRFKQVSMLDSGLVEEIIADFKPDFIVHLASYSSVAFSWENPVMSFQNNTNIFLNLIEAVRKKNIKTRVLSIGSSEEYGNVLQSDIPLTENHSVNPINPYAVARVSQELISNVYVEGYGLDIIMTRSFNHLGAGQRDVFVISSFAKQLCQIKLNGGKGIIETGDITIIRDFIDVRDVVSAYHKLLMNGESGQIYNVCSGSGISLKEVLEIMCDILDIEVEIHINKNRIRPKDNKVIIGSNDRLRKTIDWEIKHHIYDSINNIIDFWLEKIKQQS